MVKKDDASIGSRRGRSRRSAPATPAGPGSSGKPEYSSDPLSSSSLIRAIETERALLLQAYSLVKCLYETLLYADGKDAVLHADVANVAAKLIDDSVARLDFVRLAPLIEALTRVAPPNPTPASDKPRPADATNPAQPATDGSVEDRSYPYKVEDKPPYLC